MPAIFAGRVVLRQMVFSKTLVLRLCGICLTPKVLEHKG